MKILVYAVFPKYNMNPLIDAWQCSAPPARPRTAVLGCIT